MILLKKYTISIDDNKYIKKFFELNFKYKEYIKNKIYNSTLDLINNAPHKIKTVRGYKYLNKTIYEYKIPLDTNLDCRVAYVFDGEKIIFFYMSNIIRKNEFTKLVSKLSNVQRV